MWLFITLRVRTSHSALVYFLLLHVQEDFTRLQQENEQLSQQLMELESSKSSSVDSVRLELEHTKTSWEQEKEGLTQQLTSHQDVVERQAVELQQVKAELSKRDKKT